MSVRSGVGSLAQRSSGVEAVAHGFHPTPEQAAEALGPGSRHGDHRVGGTQGAALEAAVDEPPERTVRVEVILRPQVAQIGDPRDPVLPLEPAADDVG